MQTGCLFTGLQNREAFKFLGLAAAHTHQVVVITVIVVAGQFKPPTTFRQLELPQQLHRTEQPQGAIHRGQRHPLLGPQQALMDLFGTEVTAFTDPLKQRQHPLPLGGESLSPAMQGAAQVLGLQLWG